MKYRGFDLTPRDVEMTFDLSPTGDDLAITEGVVRHTDAGRRLEMTLAEGQRWPDLVKRGSTMQINVNGHLFEGPVRFRRMRKVVVEPAFSRDSESDRMSNPTESAEDRAQDG